MVGWLGICLLFDHDQDRHQRSFLNEVQPVALTHCLLPLTITFARSNALGPAKPSISSRDVRGSRSSIPIVFGATRREYAYFLPR